MSFPMKLDDSPYSEKGERKMGKMVRQGDVLFLPRDNNLDDFEGISMPQSGKYTVLIGEKSGHAHKLDGDGVTFAPAGERSRGERGAIGFALVSKPVLLTHEEHAPLTIEPGRYEIRRQRTYDPHAVRMQRRRHVEEVMD